MKAAIIFIFIIFLGSFGVKAQNVPVIKYDVFEQLSKKQNDTTYVFNFWATWCKPCVAELPGFEQLNANSKDTKVKVILISLDFKRDLDSKLKKFITDKNIQSQVYLLDELNYNAWIDQIDASWSGSLPATQIFNPKYSRLFFIEGETTFAILDSLILNSIRP